MIDEDGNLKDSKKALFADATATTLGAIVGTSSTTSYVESLAGVKAGGRTGLTTVTVAACFLIASFLAPLLSIVTVAVTTPALVTVGAMMSVNKGKIDYSDFADAASAFMTMLFMVTTFSIAEGISAGFITYVICKIGQGKIKEVHPLMIGLTILFSIHYFI